MMVTLVVVMMKIMTILMMTVMMAMVKEQPRSTARRDPVKMYDKWDYMYVKGLMMMMMMVTEQLS